MAKCRCARTKVCSDKECTHMGVHDYRDTCDIECYKRGAKGIICSRIHDKPTPKLKRVKARIWNGSFIILDEEIDGIIGKPCTVLVDAKYLKGKEKK